MPFNISTLIKKGLSQFIFRHSDALRKSPSTFSGKLLPIGKIVSLVLLNVLAVLLPK